MGTRHAALAGTPEGYRPCGWCRHARLRHADRGTGRCAATTRTYEWDEQGRTITLLAPCTCTGFTTDERLF